MRDGDDLAIICPVRFRQFWLPLTDAADFFFPPEVTWTALGEIRLKDVDGKSAGNIDYILVAYDDSGTLTDFGAVEIQAVYVSGNIRSPFELYMDDPAAETHDWSHLPHRPRPDYLSSSRKRLAPQLLFKGGIINSWGKKQAVVIHKSFWDTLPEFETVTKEDANLAWLIYDLTPDADDRLELIHHDVCYTDFESAMFRATQATAGPMDQFRVGLQSRLDLALENGDPPISPQTLG